MVHLTPRETEVLELTAQGHTAPEIAARLHRSVRTIETHLAVLKKKLGARNILDLVRLALTTKE